jgi:hypothetical protein
MAKKKTAKKAAKRRASTSSANENAPEGMPPAGSAVFVQWPPGLPKLAVLTRYNQGGHPLVKVARVDRGGLYTGEFGTEERAMRREEIFFAVPCVLDLPGVADEMWKHAMYGAAAAARDVAPSSIIPTDKIAKVAERERRKVERQGTRAARKANGVPPTGPSPVERAAVDAGVPWDSAPTTSLDNMRDYARCLVEQTIADGSRLKPPHVCVREKDHSGAHRCENGNHITEWEDGRSGSVHLPKPEAPRKKHRAKPLDVGAIIKVEGADGATERVTVTSVEHIKLKVAGDDIIGHIARFRANDGAVGVVDIDKEGDTWTRVRTSKRRAEQPPAERQREVEERQRMETAHANGAPNMAAVVDELAKDRPPSRHDVPGERNYQTPPAAPSGEERMPWD